MDRRALIVIGIVFIIVVFIALFILSLSRSAQNRRQEVSREVVGERKTIPALDVVEDPLVYDGLTIEVEGLVADWVTKRSFTVSKGQRGGLLTGGEGSELLIVTKDPLPLPKDAKESEVGLGELVNVRVQGRARITSRAELSRILGVDLGDEQNEDSDINLDDNDLIIDWRQGSIILAESVEKL